MRFVIIMTKKTYCSPLGEGGITVSFSSSASKLDLKKKKAKLVLIKQHHSCTKNTITDGEGQIFQETYVIGLDVGR